LKTIFVSVEGQTEDHFVRYFVEPYLKTKGQCNLKTILFGKGRGRNGGIWSFPEMVTELKEILRNQIKGGEYLTKMYDLAYLGNTMLEWGKYCELKDPYQKVQFAQSTLLAQFNPGKYFIPYFQLHEFEALIFAQPDILLQQFIGKNQGVQILNNQLREKEDNPELINSKDKPAQRILNALNLMNERQFKGKIIADLAGQIGIEKLRIKCINFNIWLNGLENIIRES